MVNVIVCFLLVLPFFLFISFYSFLVFIQAAVSEDFHNHFIENLKKKLLTFTSFPFFLSKTRIARHGNILLPDCGNLV